MHASEDGNVLYGAGHDPLGIRRCCIIYVDLTSQQRLVPSGMGVACHQGIECFKLKKCIEIELCASELGPLRI